MNKRLSNSEKRELNNTLEQQFQLEQYVSKKDIVEIRDDFYYINNKVEFFIRDNTIIPTLKLLQVKPLLKAVTVDMGAIKFLIKGADIMRPGITQFEEGIAKDEFVRIIDETHGKAIAIGKMMVSGEEAQNTASGKVIQNIHYVGDEIWQK